MGGWGCMMFLRNFREISAKFSGNFRENSEKIMVIRKRENDIVKREIKIFIIGLQENNSEIIPDSPVEYLRNGNLIPT